MAAQTADQAVGEGALWKSESNLMTNALSEKLGSEG